METLDRNTWLASLKTGDQVAIEQRTNNPRLATVTHSTATQIVIGSTKYRRKDGFLMGHVSGFSRPHLEQPTEERINKVEHTELRRWLSQLADDDGRGYKPVSLKVLRSLKQAYDAAQAEEIASLDQKPTEG